MITWFGWSREYFLYIGDSVELSHGPVAVPEYLQHIFVVHSFTDHLPSGVYIYRFVDIPSRGHSEEFMVGGAELFDDFRWRDFHIIAVHNVV